MGFPRAVNAALDQEKGLTALKACAVTTYSRVCTVKIRRVTGALVGIVLFAVSVLVAGIVWAYLTEYGLQRIAASLAIAVVGAGVAVVAYFLVVRYCRGRRCSLMIASLLAVLLLVPALSMLYPGKVTHSRFGLTVYSAIPVPSLDITVSTGGLLWFRDKSHFISIEEVELLLSLDVEILVIGTGWHGAVEVDPAIQEIDGIEVHLLQTPAAFELFNEFVSSGRRVTLIAHSTC